MSDSTYFFGPGKYLPPVGRPRERKKRPQECSRCHIIYDGPTESLIKNLYERGWRALVPIDAPSEMLCPDCYRIHECNERVTAE